MSGCLLDVNLLLALAWPNHQFHAPARTWLTREASKGWWTCAITELGFVRLSCNPAFTPHPRTPEEAVMLLRALKKQPHHKYLEKLAPVSSLFPAAKLLGHKQVTDRYLLALAAKHQLRLATFDVRLRELGTPSSLALLKPE